MISFFFWQPPSGTVLIVLRRVFFRWLYVDDNDKNAWIKIKRAMEKPEGFFHRFFFFLTLLDTSHTSAYPSTSFRLDQPCRELARWSLTVFLLNRYVLSSGKYHIYPCGLTVFPSLFYVQESSPCWCDVEKPKLLAATRCCSFKGLTRQ